jgi:hypothetical protein
VKCDLIYPTAESSSISTDLPDVIVENETITMSCTMSYYSGAKNPDNVVPTAYMTWSGANCVTGSSSSNSTFAISQASVVAQPLILQTCTCTQRFNAATGLPGSGYATNAPTFVNTLSSPSYVSVSCT